MPPLVLDATPLGKLAHPRRNPEIARWYREMLTGGVQIIVPEVADYEVRRSFLQRNLTRSLAILDEMKATLSYLPIRTIHMLRAAELWADARQRGLPTADPKELDCDVILAAQALEAGAIVATENAGHLTRYVTARHWRHIAVP